MRWYAVQLTAANGGFGEWERSLYGGDYGRTIKEALQKATAGEHDPDQHQRYELGKDDEKLQANWYDDQHHGDIRGLRHDERVFLVDTMYGPSYVGLERA